MFEHANTDMISVWLMQEGGSGQLRVTVISLFFSSVSANHHLSKVLMKKIKPTAQRQASCPPEWTQFGSRCFSFYSETKTWIDAETFCQTAGGHLASIHSDEENTFLKDYINQVTGANTQAWIGGSDAVQVFTWLWTDGSNFDYTSWAAGEPDDAGGKEKCLEMNWNGEQRVTLRRHHDASPAHL
ncbi:galactose-specific lectin nattectin-like [Perca flavescens]|uniref:galactose-specific lectin nattectin-like n=1 Tax=Perca flavescens TaxID=8167 RepID=UPI00106EE0E0|nr:galactose-specific lectin nattectin-like [Perca flavescens]